MTKGMSNLKKNGQQINTGGDGANCKDPGPVVRRPISVNPGLNFNLRFFIPLLKSLFGKIFSVFFKASNSHALDKNNSTEFSFKALRSEIGFYTNPGLS